MEKEGGRGWVGGVDPSRAGRTIDLRGREEEEGVAEDAEETGLVGVGAEGSGKRDILEEDGSREGEGEGEEEGREDAGLVWKNEQKEDRVDFSEIEGD